MLLLLLSLAGPAGAVALLSVSEFHLPSSEADFFVKQYFRIFYLFCEDLVLIQYLKENEIEETIIIEI